MTRRGATAMATFRFELRPRPPFRLDLTVWALRRRAANEIDRWVEGEYHRALWFEGRVVGLAMRPLGTRERPRLAVTATGPQVSEAMRPGIARMLDHLLGLRLDLSGYYQAAARNPQLAPVAERFRGFRPPRFPTVFESLLNAVAFQQLSLAVGVTLLNRLAHAYGGGRPDEPLLPRPEHLVDLHIDDLKALGFSTNKARAILELAQTARHEDLEHLADMGNAEAYQHLLSLRGIGPWSAEYVLLRGLGRLDVFPSGDAGAGNRVARWLGVPGPLDNAGVKQHLPEVAEYAGMVYFTMLLLGAAAQGFIEA